MRNLLCSLLAVFSIFPAAAQDTGALAPLPPDGFVTLDQIMKEFSTQQEAAFQKYQGMRIVVYGRIGQVGQSNDDEGDPVVVYLQQNQNSSPDVKCVFNAAGVPQGGQVNVENNDTEADFFKRGRDGDIKSERMLDVVGQMAAIRGTFDNFAAGDIVLKSCQKLKAAAAEKLLETHSSPQAPPGQ